jgi:hypothetical protein
VKYIGQVAITSDTLTLTRPDSFIFGELANFTTKFIALDQVTIDAFGNL